MRNVRPPQRATVLIGVTMMVVIATTGALLSSDGRTPTGLQLLLSLHPDNEMVALPAIEDDSNAYTVVVALARGEATSRCADPERFTQQQAGEVLPEPLATTVRAGRRELQRGRRS